VAQTRADDHQAIPVRVEIGQVPPATSPAVIGAMRLQKNDGHDVLDKLHGMSRKINLEE
jgi:hypothetical protein